MDLTENQKKLSDAASKELKSDIYLYSGDITDDGFIKLLGKTINKKSDRCLFIITTYGGSPNAAYRIAKWLQSCYSTVDVFPSGICASAGTLIATCSDTLIMSPISELGPLDIQLLKNNDITGRKSGLVTHATLEELKSSTFDLFEHILLKVKIQSGGNVTFETASKVATELAGSVMSAVYSQIDPDVLGENRRNLSIAEEYGKRLSSKHKNINITGIRRLVHGYPSHDFVIDMEEAEELFERVIFPPVALANLVFDLGEIALKPAQRTPCVYRVASFKPDESEALPQEDNGHEDRTQNDASGVEPRVA